MDISKTIEVTPKNNGAEKRFVSAIILAAGSGSRMGVDKITAQLLGVPVISYSIRAMAQSNADEIIIVASRSNIEAVRDIADSIETDKAIKVITGGETRAESAINAFNAIDERAEIISVHDGARPLVSSSICDRVCERAAECGGAIAAVWVKDTIKKVENGMITATPERKYLMQAQTPQSFTRDIYKRAIEYMEKHPGEITDDASAAEAVGCQVAIVEGDYRNIKLTTPDDLIIAEMFLRNI